MSPSTTAAALHEWSVAETAAALRGGSVTAAELVEDALARIEAIDPRIRSFIRVTAARALADAARADKELAAGIDRGPLHGIPYALKDIYATRGIPTTCNSRLRIDHVPEEDAFVETRLREGGAVLLGKLNTHEFALGGPSEDLPFPPARNPWNPDHFTGGSSSGCGAAIAAGLVRIAFGSDTGGSIRSPASHCGVVGLKPTYGLVSCRGMYPLSYTLDHGGPMGWTVDDVAIALSVIAAFDPADPASVDVPIPDYPATLHGDIAGLRIGYARSFFDTANGVSPELIGAMDAAAQTLAKLGADVEIVELPDFEMMKACGRLIMIAEAFAIHEDDLRTRPHDYARYTYQRLVAGAAVTAADLTNAFRLRRELTVTLNADVLRRYDALITATGIAPAAPLSDFPIDWPPPSAASAVQTAPFNATGNPALAVPVGSSSDGLPLGMQIVGRLFDEATVLRVGAAFEAATRDPRIRPAIAAGKSGA